MNPISDGLIDLPIRGTLASSYVLSLLTALLLAVASAGGLLFPAGVYPAEAYVRAFLPNDVANLFIGLPVLLGSMLLARRGRLAGLLCWPGALFFVLYNYLAYAIALPLTWAFLLHLALLALSAYTLIALMASLDEKAIQTRLAGAVPERLAGGVLAGLGLLFFLRVIGVIASALAGGTPLPETELAVNAADFLVTPAWVVGGILLWRRRALGYAAGLGLLFQASMLFVALILYFLLQPLLTGTPFAAADAAVILAMGLVCFVPFALFLRGVIWAPPSASLE